MLHMVIEQYRGGDPSDAHHCCQIMECDDPQLLEQWMAHWTDLIDFDVVPVVTSAEAAAAITPRLEPRLAPDPAPK